ncbi:response regulator [Marinigracilibium pacificum]|uniref:Response regulator n=1 Tax=Marinigracilibium pacificum TaxID=2729599 RepID=A0A848J0F7_9BACT|nr:response regulator [Marinigracilibium pacificum]NMM49141.1 response regulator [Marinigracilibium pacificum]
MSAAKKVLIAEDSSVIQNLTKKILIIQNYQISSAKNGEEVIKALNDTDFDVILMDINMPKMDGMECAKQIRAMDNPEKSSTPIIAITGNAKNYSMDDFTAVGINEYIPKPINFDDLVKAVKKYTS